MSDNIPPDAFQVIWDDLMDNGNSNFEYITAEEFQEKFDLDPNELFIEMSTDETVNNGIQSNENVEIMESVIPEGVPVPDSSNESDPSLEFVSLSTEDVSSFIENAQNKNTLRKTQTDLNKFTRFLESKGESREIFHIDVDLLDEYVAMFILSVRKQDGSEYEPSSLRNFISSLDRKLRRHKYPHLIMASAGPHFSLTRDALKAKQKTLKRMGRGNKPREAEPLTTEEIDILYEKKLLGCDAPSAILNTLWLNNCLHFGLRGTLEQYNLRWGDLTLKTASDGTEYIELNERQTKTRTGENLCDARTVAPKMFACTGARNPVEIYKLYKEKRPSDFCQNDDSFYIAPRTVPINDDPSCKWFKKQPVGIRKIGSILKTMAKDAGLNPSKKLTNHSARKHLVQKLRDSDIAPTDIMQMSGHKNVQSILNYSNISEKKQKECSNLLSAPESTALGDRSVVVNIPSEDGLNIPQTHDSTGICSSQVVQSQRQISNFNVALPSNAMSTQPQFPTHQLAMSSSSTHSYGSMFFGASFNVTNFNVYTGATIPPPSDMNQ